MDFSEIWDILKNRGRVAHFYQMECEYLWSQLSPEQQQAVVDDYFIARDQGASAKEARRIVGEKHQMSLPRTDRIIRGFFEEAKKRRKYNFLQKYAPLEEHILDF